MSTKTCLKTWHRSNVSEKGFNKIKEDLKDTINDFKEDSNDKTSGTIYKWSKLLLHEIEDYEKSDEINLWKRR